MMLEYGVLKFIFCTLFLTIFIISRRLYDFLCLHLVAQGEERDGKSWVELYQARIVGEMDTRAAGLCINVTIGMGIQGQGGGK